MGRMVMAPSPYRCLTTGKRRYRTHREALIGLVDIVFDLNGHGTPGGTKPCRTYYCVFCAGYHLTSKPWNPKKEAAIARLTPVPQRVDSTPGIRDTARAERRDRHGTHR